MLLQLLCHFLLLVPTVLGYPFGPPSSTCNSMTPQHNPFSPQNSDPPYRIVFPQGQTTYSENEDIQVTLEGIEGEQLRGFMIQPRSDVHTYATYGSIPTNPAGTGNSCASKGAGKDVSINHIEGQPKDAVTFAWRAPASNVGTIVFVFTVVEAKSTFWVKETSSPLTYQPKPESTTKKTTDTVTGTVTKDATSGVKDTTETKSTPSVVTESSSSSSPSTQINRDPECEMTKGCFPASTECSTDCNYLVTWRVSGDEDVEFTFEKKTSSNNYWIGIGFSDDGRMGNDSVVECVSNSGIVDVKISFNTVSPKDLPDHNNRPANDQFGVDLIRGSYTNGILSCIFTRKISGVLTDASSGMENVFFDLNEEWQLLVAHGPARGGNKDPHQVAPEISVQKIDFLTVDTNSGTTPSLVNTEVIKKDSRCGESLGCYHDCNHADACGFLLTWEDRGNSIAFMLKCNRPGNNVYCAVGMSKDKKMGDDSVFECVSSGGEVSVYGSYNDGRVNYRFSQDKFGITNVTATHEDGILKCIFLRKKTAALAEQSRNRVKRARDPSADTFFDANDDFNLLYAYGSSVGGFINQHRMHPKISTEKADFQTSMDIGAKAAANTLVKVHGILMMFAWMFFARLGMFVAGRYKTTWPEGMEWCGLKRWFVLHRCIMATTFFASAAGFVIIFVHVGEYSKITSGGFQKSHPIIGIIVMCLVTINPIMALFRPKPDAPTRPYFKFAHLFVGITAYICAIVNMFSGFEQTSANVPEEAKIVVQVYLGWVVLIEIGACIYDVKSRKASKGEAYEMSPTAGYVLQNSEKDVSTVKVGILILHAVSVLGLTIAVSVLVWQGKD